MNNSNLDQENFEELLGAFEGLKEMTRKSEQKRELKMWSDLSLPFSLQKGLKKQPHLQIFICE